MKHFEKCLIYIGILSILISFMLDEVFNNHFIIFQIMYVILLWIILLIIPRLVVRRVK